MAPQIAGWTHACLPCDATWKGSEPHVCTEPAMWRAQFWASRLATALKALSPEDVYARVMLPFTRSELVKLLGPSWATDELGAMQQHIPSTPAAEQASEARAAAGAFTSFDDKIPRKPVPELHGQHKPAAARRAAARRKT